MGGSGINVIPTQSEYTVMIEYVGGNPVYVGEAIPGTATSKAEWRIKRLTYDASDNPVTILWASGTVAFKHKWDDRASYDYS
jgi:YD repeat-containing protein